MPQQRRLHARRLHRDFERRRTDSARRLRYRPARATTVLYERQHDVRDRQQGHPDHLRVAVQPGQQRQQQDRHHERLLGVVHGRRTATGSCTSASTRTRTTATTTSGSGSSRATPTATRPAATRPSPASHTDGDVLVVSEFTNGGGVSSITAYRWAGGANGCIDSDGDRDHCDGLRRPAAATARPRRRSTTICATTNSGANPWNTNITTKWLTVGCARSASGHTVVPPDFFEGGINITADRSTNSGQHGADVLQHLHRRHPLVAVADRDAVRLRSRTARRVRRDGPHDAVGLNDDGEL